MDPARPEVRALAARGDRIVAMGTAAEMQPYIGPADRDHGSDRIHRRPWTSSTGTPTSWALASRAWSRPHDATSWDEIVTMVAGAAAAAEARRLDPRPRLASGKVVAAAAAERGRVSAPRCLSRRRRRTRCSSTHASGHAAFVNAEAMAAAGITAAARNPPRRRDPEGSRRPTRPALLRETRIRLSPRGAGATGAKKTPAEAQPTLRARRSSWPSEESLRRGITIVPGRRRKLRRPSTC